MRTDNLRAPTLDISPSDFTFGLSGREFFLFFQPEVHIPDYTLGRIEILLRWNHPSHGFLVADNFIPVATMTGHLAALEEHVVRLIAQEIEGFLAHTATLNVHLLFSLNLSEAWQKPDFCKKLRRWLRAALSKHVSTLEIPAYKLPENLAHIRATLHKLTRHGFSLTLDQTGPRILTLGELQALSFSAVKIHRRFWKIVQNREDIISGVAMQLNEMQRSNIRVIASAVETEEEVVFLHNTLGISWMQGEFFYPAFPKEDLMKLTR
ncbi:EAL domain-containing protein [Magnetococcales bacterium HHB-1]